MALIPGLPDDLARECLVRVQYNQFSTISSVCKAWKFELQSPEFRLFRKQTSRIQKLIVVPHVNFLNRIPISSYEFTVLDPETGVWSSLPPPPDLPKGLPIVFWKVVSPMSGLVLLVCLSNSNKSQYRIHAFLFDLLSSKWRRGASISGMDPVYDGCTSDGDHMVYLLCNTHNSKSRSIIAYDTEKNNWTTLSDTLLSCYGGYRAIFHHGNLHIVCQEDFKGTPTWKTFDVSTRQWNQSKQKLFDSLELLSIVCEDSGEWYACSYDENVLKLRGSTWKVIAKLPFEVRNTKFMTLWKRKLVVLGSELHAWSYSDKAYVLDLQNLEWTRLKTPEQLGYFLSPCSIEI